MAVNPNEDTEFNDALRKHGILPPKEAPPPSPSPPPSPTLSDFLDDFSPSEMRELADEAKDDETERAILAYRRQRIEQDKREERKARFGRVYPIARDDYTREVTEASVINEEGDDNEQGTAVICFLYKDGIPRSEVATTHIHNLAARYPRTKFVSIIGDKCIPNLPDTRIPMLIIYKKGEIRQQITSWGADRPRKLEELEALLVASGALIPSAKAPVSRSRDDNGSDSEDDDSDPSSRMRSAATSTNRRPEKNLRRGGKDDGDDSDFDFDL